VLIRVKYHSLLHVSLLSVAGNYAEQKAKFRLYKIEKVISQKLVRYEIVNKINNDVLCGFTIFFL
jgi:hypothetical protein